jgi:hypothetical protein
LFIERKKETTINGVVVLPILMVIFCLAEVEKKTEKEKGGAMEIKNDEDDSEERRVPE